MADQVINFPRDTTLKRANALQRAIAAGCSTPGTADLCYKHLVADATTKDEVDSLFIEWWKAQYDSTKYTKVQMLERWFGNVLDDDRVHGCTTPLYATSTSAIGELTDDSVGLVCTPSTASTRGRDDFAHMPQFWCLEVSAEKKEDGSHEIFYVEHIDDLDDVRSGEHLCWVLQKNTFVREWCENGYQHLQMKCHQTTGFKQWREGKDRTGHVYAYMAHPKYYAGKDSSGKVTCGTCLAPVNYTSHTSGVALWRTRGTQYSGASGSLPKFLDRMTRLKYARKGNSGTIEGCTTYNFQYKASVSETGVKRFILTLAQAANLFVGSAVCIGTATSGSSDRNTADVHDIATEVRITAIQNVTIDETEYAAVYVDVTEAFDTVQGQTLLSTMPYFSGWNDDVLGTDGSKFSATSGKEPGLLQKIEFMNGSYLIVSDEIWQWGKDENDDYTFDCYLCKDQSKVSGTAITADYVKQEGLTLTFPKGNTNWRWQYIEDTDCGDVEWPSGVNASGSGVGCKAGFYCAPAGSGLRAAWCWGYLGYGGLAGVACRHSNYSLGSAIWDGSLGAPDSAG